MSKAGSVLTSGHQSYNIVRANTDIFLDNTL